MTKIMKSLSMIIYKIENSITGQIYIGQTYFSFWKRYGGNNWWKRVTSPYLSNSLLKYGHLNFKIEILEHNVESLDKLNELEIFYINSYNSIYPNGFNFTSGGKNCKLLESTKDLLSKDYEIKNYKTGFTFSIRNLSRFCKENKINYFQMHHVLSRSQRTLTCGDFCHPSTTTEDLDNRGLRSNRDVTYEFLSPDGVLFTVNNLQKFCKQMNLNKDGMNLLAKGRIFTNKGWKNPLFNKEAHIYEKIFKKYEGLKVQNQQTKEISTIYNILEFCASKGFNVRHFALMLRKKIKMCYSYTLYEF